MSRTKIPVLIVTGFLGSGKTTLLNRLLSQPSMAGTLAIINEFGEVGLDHLLLEVTEERMALLESGCICCTVRDDLVQTLLDVDNRRRAGTLHVDRVIIETTGLADPAPILHALMADDRLEATYDIETVVTLVDAVSGAASLASFQEARKQLAYADQVILTKGDIASAAEHDEARNAITAGNPSARVREVSAGEISADLLLQGAFSRRAQDAEALAEWSSEVERLIARAIKPGGGHERHTCDAHCDHVHTDVSTYAFTFEQPVDWRLFCEWLDNLAALKGPDLLRLKGIVHIAQDRERPMVIHCVQHVFNRPRQLEAWPSSDRRTRLVFIVKNIDREVIERTLVKFVALDPGQMTGVHLRSMHAQERQFN